MSTQLPSRVNWFRFKGGIRTNRYQTLSFVTSWIIGIKVHVYALPAILNAYSDVACGVHMSTLDVPWDHVFGIVTVVIRGPFYWQGLTLIPAWISNYMPGKVWDEITYPFQNFNGCNSVLITVPTDIRIFIEWRHRHGGFCSRPHHRCYCCCCC